MGSSPTYIPQAPDNNQAATNILIAQLGASGNLFNQKLKSDLAFQQARGGIETNLLKDYSDAQIGLQRTQKEIETGYLQSLAKGQLGFLETQGAIQTGQLKARDAVQSSLLDLQNQQLLREAQFAPTMERFDANKAAEESKKFAIGNVQRQREAEEILNPEAARMRKTLGADVERLTGKEYEKEWMNELIRSGIIRNLKSGLGSGTLSEASFADQSLEQKRKRDMENMALRDQFVKQTPQIATIDPQSLISQQQQTEQRNLNRMNDWRQGIVQAARGLGENVGQVGMANVGALSQMQNQNLSGLSAQQAQNISNFGNLQFAGANRVREDVLGSLNTLGQTQIGNINALSGQQAGNYQSMSDFLNRSMSGALSLNQTNRQEWRDYQNALSQISAQNAANQNATTGALLGAAGSIGGAALGSMLMPGVGTAAGAAAGSALAGQAAKPGYLRGLYGG
jgi:hypothetical protein